MSDFFDDVNFVNESDALLYQVYKCIISNNSFNEDLIEDIVTYCQKLQDLEINIDKTKNKKVKNKDNQKTQKTQKIKDLIKLFNVFYNSTYVLLRKNNNNELQFHFYNEENYILYKYNLVNLNIDINEDYYVELNMLKKLLIKDFKSVYINKNFLFFDDISIPYLSNIDNVFLDKFNSILSKKYIFDNTLYLQNDVIGKVLPCVTKDNTKRFLKRICLDNNYIVATDGKRLVRYYYDFKLQNKVENLLLSYDICNLIDKIGCDLEVSFSNDYIRYIFSNIEIIEVRNDKKFPSYNCVIPDYDNDTSINIINIDKAEILEIDKQILLYLKLKNSVAVSFDKNTIKVLNDVRDAVLFEKELNCLKDNSFTIAFDYYFLKDLFKSTNSNNLIFKFKDNKSIVRVYDTEDINFTYVIMPLFI